MKDRWIKKKAASRKSKKSNDKYTAGDFLADLLFWLPELLFLPFRIVFWLLRGIGRFIFDLF